jgi:streptomycin 6-kinase|tara:strand:- start:1513 stop:2370 length:858 start_codon:yes stop_codon:yes gene_type:complete
MSEIFIPKWLVTAANRNPDGSTWLQVLPAAIEDLADRWSLSIEPPIEEEASCSWVARCTRHDGTQAVLKLGLPHREARHEIDGLAFWDGDPTVYLLERDVELNAMLLECCDPGTTLRTLPEEEQDEVIAGLLPRLWRAPPLPAAFRPLSEMITCWSDESRQQADNWPDRDLAEEGLRIYQELSDSATEQVLLATDLHAGNVLKAQREPWLVIDPKPFYGDPTYDATQHLLNCRDRLRDDPHGTIDRFSGLLGIDRERVRLWTFARLATQVGGDPNELQALARLLK